MSISKAITSGRPKALSNEKRIKRFESRGETPTFVKVLTPCSSCPAVSYFHPFQGQQNLKRANHISCKETRDTAYVLWSHVLCQYLMHCLLFQLVLCSKNVLSLLWLHPEYSKAYVPYTPERQKNALSAALPMQSWNFTCSSEPIANERQCYINTHHRSNHQQQSRSRLRPSSKPEPSASWTRSKANCQRKNHSEETERLVVLCFAQLLSEYTSKV